MFIQIQSKFYIYIKRSRSLSCVTVFGHEGCQECLILRYSEQGLKSENMHSIKSTSLAAVGHDSRKDTATRAHRMQPCILAMHTGTSYLPEPRHPVSDNIYLAGL